MDKYSEKRFDIYGYDKIDTDVLETMEYEYPEKDTIIEYHTEEFSSVCPWTGLPDNAKLTIRYIPGNKLVELKSLKYYLTSYRNIGILQEHAVNRILDDLVKLLAPKYMEIIGDFVARGGISTKVMAKYNGS
ncbi:NADPH-dependent 7-cyano-7-deazaguanine reductase QueF [Biomaibacter acetigenes]|jgi:7-cyano-7-deazaguanine reductase|uniref:NADPH-dependent 7-cyano-7-deazaguanine reductase n=1 Tax=Biomaibacter acetigenes TaxID=2316383 RepID=A0A3G2R7F8_9FIRM|nr:preQ(1) synthase [Biomaibacter acetigenes]AYO31454.1 NADPH-dependent 7-cyano-7-deazaguanine reductase QueF [Biomaibacter acetigenes]RKL62650.1 NADPH-dependent 7-cyano-7-deazaguanine reductase QueF [Thermoanaerobacteraceae bacterium SP2]